MQGKKEQSARLLFSFGYLYTPDVKPYAFHRVSTLVASLCHRFRSSLTLAANQMLGIHHVTVDL